MKLNPYIFQSKFDCELAADVQLLSLSDSLWLRGMQHARLLCPAPSPGVCSNSRPSCWWCCLTIHPLLPPSPFVFNPSQHQGLLQRAASLYQVAKVLELQIQHHCFYEYWRVDFLQDWLVWSTCSPQDSQKSSLAWQFKASVLQCTAFLMAQLSHP